MSSRRVSLPVTLLAPQRTSPSRLSPPFLRPTRRKSRHTFRSTPPPHSHHRSLSCHHQNQCFRHHAGDANDIDECSTSGLGYNFSPDSESMETNNNASAKDRLQSAEGQLRSFKYKNGSLVDNGFELKALPKAIGRKRGENRRATCPEIYLCPESNLPARQVVVRLYGSRNSGKKTLAHQIYHIASTTTPDQTHVLSGETDTVRSKSINFLLNGEEVNLEIVIESTLESSLFTNHLTVFVVLYSADNRESFKRATGLLYRICQTRKSAVVPVLLVGNKMDLKRNIVVPYIEGKSLAKIYNCGFIEISALLSMNVGSVWTELIRLIHLIRMSPSESSSCKTFCAALRALTAPDPLEYQATEQSWVHRLMLRGRHLAKSCEELVQRIIA